jgi:soluble lytic murein transglycosylase-like protein
VTKQELIALAKQVANAHQLYPELVCGLVEQESNWNPWALRYEPDFMRQYVAPLFTTNKISGTEAYARAFSWGLMQLMGQTAREAGFAGASLAELCDPTTNLEFGCRIFARKLAAAEGNAERALLLWNGGGNKAYPGQVMARAENYKP